MNAPLISVIVPVYNTEKYLHRCIDCILAQTFSDFELLLIDDGSTDSSGEICDEYAKKDNRVKVFHKPNGGASSARNMGIDNVRGEWITFCDSDDRVYPTWLQNFAENREGVELVCQGIEVDRAFTPDDVMCDGKWIYSTNYKGNVRDGLSKLLNKYIVGYLFIKCFKRDIIIKKNLKFNIDFKLQEDEDFVLRYMMWCENMKSVDNVGYYYYLPDWEHKYKINNMYETTQALLINCLLLKKRKWDNVCEFYWYYHTSYFFERYKIAKEREKRCYLLEYRKILGNLLWRSKLFIITKLFIWIDFTGYISSIIMNFHIKIKRI